jgi:cell division protein FtsB
MLETIVTIVVSLIAGLTSAKAWDFWKHKVAIAAELEREETAENNVYRDDLRKEVSDLRTKLELANERIMGLTKRLAEMVTRVEFLERENDTLKGAATAK